MYKKVSIIMPAYNASKTIEQSVLSVVSQSYNSWELIIVDDCSKDSTPEIVKSFIADHSYCDIKLYANTENRGVSYSRNYGIDHASGDWIAFLDSDDLWDSDKLKAQMDYISSMHLDKGLLFTGSAFIDENGDKLDYVFHVPEKINKQTLLKQNVISCSSVVVSRDLMHQIKFPDSNKLIHEDYAVWLKMLDIIEYAYGIDEPLLVYRVSSGSKSARKSKAAIMNWNTYRYIGLNLPERIFYMINYTIRGFMKWRNLKINI